MAAVIVLVLLTARAVAADSYPTVHLAVHVAAQHNSLELETGNPSDWGPRYELTVGFQPIEQISIWGVAAESSYHASGLVDIERTHYDIDVTDEWLGLRLLFHPVRYLFVGAGYSKVYTTQKFPAATEDSEHTTWEFVVGSNVYQTGHVTLQALVTAGEYDRFFGAQEHVSFYSLGAGVQF